MSDHEAARRRLLEQERRVSAVDRAIEVIRRDLDIDEAGESGAWPR